MSGKARLSSYTENPTKNGYSRATIQFNIAQLMHDGMPQKQAIAAALDMARRAYKKRFPTGQLPEYLKPAKTRAKRVHKAVTKKPAEKAPVKKAIRSNPEPHRGKQLEQAMDLYQRFSGHEPEVVGRTKRPKIPNVGIVIGEMDGVTYETVRDGEKLQYFHRFNKKSRPLLVSSFDGKQLFIVGGRYDFTEDGIVDKD